MKSYIVYNNDGKILRTGMCPDEAFLKQAQVGEFVMEGAASDYSQKIVNGKVVNKTPEEIVAENPPEPEVPWGDQPAQITNKEWEAAKVKLGML